jgi:signal transduction histidine kinase
MTGTSLDQDLGTRGLLHDLGHQLMTVSLLAESLHADGTLTAEARQRADLVVQETARALEMISRTAGGGDRLAPGEPAGLTDVRDVAARVARLTQLTHKTAVRVNPGQPTYLRVDPMTAWRVLSNIVENAARAAGPDGLVNISIRRDAGTVIEITDSGAGPGSAPRGTAGLGLSVVTGLLADCGGGLDISAVKGGGTSARAVFGTDCDRAAPPPQPGAKAAA